MRLAAVVAASLASACAHEERERERAEAARVSRAVDLLRQAPKADKAPLLQGLRGTACSFERVCELKRTCAGAYELYVHALASAHVARHGLGGDAGSDAESAALVLAAQRNLEQSHSLQQKCLAVQGALKRELKL